MELPHPPGALGLGVDAAKHVGVALRVEHDDGFTAPDVLRHQQFQKPRFAGAGGPDHHHVSYPLRQRQVDIPLVGLNAVERRIAPDLGHRRHRIPPGRPAGQRGCPREPGVLVPQLEPARQAIEPGRLPEMRVFRPARVDQALGMHRGPAEAAAEKELVAGPGDAVGGQHVVRRLPEVALKAQHALRLNFAAQRVRKEQRSDDEAGARGQHQDFRPGDHPTCRRECGDRRMAFHGGAKQILEGIGHPLPFMLCAGAGCRCGLAGGTGAKKRSGCSTTTPFNALPGLPSRLTT